MWLLLLLNLGQQASGKSRQSIRIDSACHHRREQCAAATQRSDGLTQVQIRCYTTKWVNGGLKTGSGRGLITFSHTVSLTLHVHDLVNRADDLVYRAYDLVNRADDLVNRRHDLLNRRHDILNRRHDLLNRARARLVTPYD